MKKRKYGNKKVERDGFLFDSKREADRWTYLCQLMDAGVIKELGRQVVFELLPAQYEFDGEKRGKCIERSVKYIADFVYKDQFGRKIVEDTKGYKTPEYVLKRKLMLYIHGIRVKEV